MAAKTIRVVTHESDGSLRTMDYETFDTLESTHEKIGIDDSSTDLTLRGMPIFRGLIGPIPESKTVVRYESPEVFEMLTKEWSQQKVKRQRRRKSAVAEAGPVPMGMGIEVPTSMPTEA